MSWKWRLETADDSAGTTATIENPVHASQSDAESWVGEMWPELAEQGVTGVSLFHDGQFVYGPMLLSE